MTTTACLQPVRQYLRQIAAAVLLMLCASAPATAADSKLLHIDASGPVVYCDIGPISERDQFVRILKEGTPLTLSWELVVERVRNYWLNQEVGTVSLTRQVIPDLVSRSWQLIDSNSGISRKVARVEDAADFLAYIQRFAVIDRSLLQPGERYLITVNVHIAEGIPVDSWWRNMIRFSDTVGSEELHLP